MNEKGLTTIVIIFVIVAAVIIVGGIFYYARPAIAPAAPTNGGGQAGQPTTTANPLPLPASSSAPTPAPTTPSGTSASLSPKNGPVGTIVTIHGNGFGATNTIEMNGLVGASMKNIVSADGKTLSFKVPDALGPNCKPGQMCPQFLIAVTPNAYPVTVITNGTTLEIGVFTVTAR